MSSVFRALWHLPDPSDDSEQRWDREVRDGETVAQRLDRDWSVLVQELRVLQTGVQVLAGFLLIVPFQSHFDVLDGPEVVVYLFTVAFAVAAVAFLLAPIAMHRVLFRRHEMRTIVVTTHREAVVGLLCLALALAGSAAIVVLATTDSAWGAGLAAGGLGLLLAWLWVWVPLRSLARIRASGEDA